MPLPYIYFDHSYKFTVQGPYHLCSVARTAVSESPSSRNKDLWRAHLHVHNLDKRSLSAAKNSPQKSQESMLSYQHKTMEKLKKQK